MNNENWYPRKEGGRGLASNEDFVDSSVQGFEYYLKKNLFVWVLWHINLCRLFNAKCIFMQLNTSISDNSVSYKYTAYLSKTFLFQVIQFS